MTEFSYQEPFPLSEDQTEYRLLTRDYVSVKQLVQTAAEVAGKRIEITYVDGPVGVESRNFSNRLIESIGWKSKVSFREGIARTYPWIAEQVEAQRRGR